MASNSLHRLLGSNKQLTMYVGIVWATALIRISFLALVKDFSFQPFNLLATFSLTIVNTCFFDLPTTVERPKYLSCRSTLFTRSCLLVAVTES